MPIINKKQKQLEGKKEKSAVRCVSVAERVSYSEMF